MASIMYKDGRKEYVEPQFFESMLQGGWSVTEEPEPSADAEDLDDDEKPDIADLRTAKQVRQEAKEAGIQVWESARIQTLKALIHERTQD